MAKAFQEINLEKCNKRLKNVLKDIIREAEKRFVYKNVHFFFLETVYFPSTLLSCSVKSLWKNSL